MRFLYRLTIVLSWLGVVLGAATLIAVASLFTSLSAWNAEGVFLFAAPAALWLILIALSSYSVRLAQKELNGG
jgi:hypothetical protein